MGAATELLFKLTNQRIDALEDAAKPKARFGRKSGGTQSADNRRLGSFSDSVPDLSIFMVLLPLLFVVFFLFRRFQPSAAKWFRSLTSKKSEWILPRYGQDLDDLK